MFSTTGTKNVDKKGSNPAQPAPGQFRTDLLRYAISLMFLLGAMYYASRFEQGGMMLVASALIGAYMAMNIGANDVANNVGPAVGSKALSMGGALIVAAIFEAAGALIAGGDVVGTIRSGIIDPAMIPDPDTFIWLMMAALLAGALWLNIATAVGAPVSTTHSIVGAVLGAGVAASGFDIANWSKVGAIAASWVISPVLGGLIAAAFLYLIKRSITYQQDMSAAATRTVPILVALMAWVFSVYLMLKGLNQIWKIGFTAASLYGLVFAVAVYLVVKPGIARRAAELGNSKHDVNQFFTLPLIFAAALLSFAHGSNDVANAVGPLAAIVDTVSSSAGEIHKSAAIPFWVMMLGALGLVLGLALFGPKVIRTVGSEITELDQMRAYCIAMAATLTVIVASQMGLPVSSTHIAVGGVFGVGFLREYLKSRYAVMIAEIRAHHHEDDQEALDAFLVRFQQAPIHEKGDMLEELKIKAREQNLQIISREERKGLRKAYRKELVKRSQMLRIAAAWVITVPASAVMAALIFYALRGAFLA